MTDHPTSRTAQVWTSRLLLAVLLAAASACQTTPPGGGANGSATEDQIPSSAPTEPLRRPSGGASPTAIPQENDLEFGRTLQALDQRVDEFVALSAQSGDDARGRRRILSAYIASEAGKHIDALVGLAADPSAGLRQRIAVKSIGFTRDGRVVPTLTELLRTSQDTHILTSAGYGLGRMADPQTSLPPLITAASHTDRDVRNNALLALWHVLDARAEQGATPLDDRTRESAMAAIENALFDPDAPLVRGHAAAAMGALGDARGVDPLLNLLRDTNVFVRTQTALALGKLGDRRAVEPLVDIIDETERGTVRDAVLLGISVLVEKQGFTVPESLPDEERAWRAFIERTLGRSFDVPNLRGR